MNEAAQSTTDPSLLLWILAATVATLTAHVALGWIRVAQRQPALRQRWPAWLVSSATLGTGLCAAVVLSIAAEGMAFDIGYRFTYVPVLWLVAIGGCLPVTLWVMQSQRWWSLLGSGLLLAALASAVQFGWIQAAGFRPGTEWRYMLVAVAVVLMIVGLCAGLFVAYSRLSRESHRRTLWRLGAAALIGLTMTSAQEVMMTAAGLVAQVGSVYRHEVPGPVLCLVFGVLLPLVLGVMTMDLVMRRNQPRHGSSTGMAPRKRRKRRHRVRSL